MESRMCVRIQELFEKVAADPSMMKILDEDPHAEINPLLHDHIQDPAFLVGYDFLGLIRKTERALQEQKYDKTKIRRRIEEYLRKYGSDQFIIGLALFLGISTD